MMSNWVLAINSNFLIPLSLQPRFKHRFKHRLCDQNILGCTDINIKNQSLKQRLYSFINEKDVLQSYEEGEPLWDDCSRFFPVFSVLKLFFFSFSKFNLFDRRKHFLNNLFQCFMNASKKVYFLVILQLWVKQLYLIQIIKSYSFVQ